MRRLLSLCALSVALAGCAEDPPKPVPSPSPRESVNFEGELAARDAHLHTVGPGGDRVYGSEAFHGETTFRGQTCGLDFDVVEETVSGVGSLHGALTLDCPNGELGLRTAGSITPGEAAGANYSGEVEVLGGTDEYITNSGRGNFSGQRAGGLSGPLDLAVTLDLYHFE